MSAVSGESRPPKVGMVSFGCAKNLVDAEISLQLKETAGAAHNHVSLANNTENGNSSVHFKLNFQAEGFIVDSCLS